MITRNFTILWILLLLKLSEIIGTRVTEPTWFNEKPESVFFEAGAELKFSCSCSSITKVAIDYKHNGIKVDAVEKDNQPVYMGAPGYLKNRTTSTSFCKRNLVFKSAKWSDAGEVECICEGNTTISATAVMKTHDEVEASVFVNSVDKLVAGDDVIKVLVPYQASSKEKLSNVTLACELYMDDECHFIAWIDKRRNKEILRTEQSNPRSLVSTLWVGPDNINSLYGEYACECTFATGEQKWSKTVLIGRPPVVSSLREEQLVISGETRKSVLTMEDISERTFGYPPANPMWSRWVQLRNGSLVNKEVKFEGSRFIYEGSKLIIMNTQYEDAGKYECLINNPFGNFSFTISLKVIDKYAAIWPFFGLSIAVIFLMVAIIFFERHTKKED